MLAAHSGRAIQQYSLPSGCIPRSQKYIAVIRAYQAERQLRLETLTERQESDDLRLLAR